MHAAMFFALFALFLRQCVAAAPDRMLVERQFGGDLSFCFGENSICDISNQLFSQCDNYLNQLTEWYKCLCGNGYVSVDEA